MTRMVNRPVEVTLGAGGLPIDFQLKGFKRIRVSEVLDSWLEIGRWWEQEGEQTTYRVITEEGGVHELTCDSTAKRWILYKSYD